MVITLENKSFGWFEVYVYPKSMNKSPALRISSFLTSKNTLNFLLLPFLLTLLHLRLKLILDFSDGFGRFEFKCGVLWSEF